MTNLVKSDKWYRELQKLRLIYSTALKWFGSDLHQMFLYKYKLSHHRIEEEATDQNLCSVYDVANRFACGHFHRQL